MPYFIAFTVTDDEDAPEDSNVHYSKLIMAGNRTQALQLAKKLFKVKYTMRERDEAHTCGGSEDDDNVNCPACDETAVDVIKKKIHRES